MSSDPYVRVSVPAKPFWESKVLWTQVIGVAVQVLLFVLDPQSRFNLSPEVVPYVRLALVTLQAVLTAFFRATPDNVPLALSSGEQQVRDYPAAAPGRWGRD